MGGSRNAWHKQIRVVYMSPPESHCVEAGNAASLWVYSTIFIPLSGTTRFGLGAKNAISFSSPGLDASRLSLLVFLLWWLDPSAQHTCRPCLLGSYFTGLRSLPLLFLYYIYTLLAI